MKKSSWNFITAAVLLFTGSYWLGKKSSPHTNTVLESPAPKAVSAPEDLVANKEPSQSLGKVAKKVPAQTSAALGWENLHGGELYTALFDQKTFSGLDTQDVSKLQDFFAKPYPKLEALYKEALLERLGVLKALEQQQSLRRAPSSVTGLRDLYAQVLTNSQENWLVKRQAFRNLQPALSLQEKEKYYRGLNSRVVSLAAKSEREIVEEVLRESR